MEGDLQTTSLDPHGFESQLEQILTGLFNLSQEGDRSWWSGLEISHYLRDEHGIQIHWRTIDSLIGKNRDYAHRRKRKLRWEYYLLAPAEDLISEPEESIIVVDPCQAIQATLSLHALLSERKGDVRVCDPYLDPKTIEHLDALPNSASVRLLTQTVRDSGKLRRVVGAARSVKSKFEIRVVSNNHLHDRYIVDDKDMLILGTSLNGFGKKQCFIVKAGQDIRKIMLSAFDTSWGKASRWP